MARVFSFPSRYRLRNAHEISLVFDFACRVSAQHLVAIARPNGLSFPRIAIMVPKKTARSAVRRNYMRRVIREKLRLSRTNLGPLDLVVKIKAAFISSEYASIWQELDVIFSKIQKCHAS